MKENLFTPVDPDFYEIVAPYLATRVRVVFFTEGNKLDEFKGNLKWFVMKDKGEFLDIESDKSVRIDRIITINEKPGSAFDEYDSYANACLSCQAGYDD